MKLAFAVLLALLFAGCNTTVDPTGSPGGDGGAGGAGGATSTTGTAGTAGTTGTGGAMPPPSAAVCPEVAAGASSCTPQNYHDPLVDYVADASFVFRGTVTAVHAATPDLPITDTSHTIVVHVDKLLTGGDIVPVEGQAVTVQMLADPTMAAGYVGYFFAQVWLIGATVGMTEVAHVDPGVYPDIESDVPGIVTLLADERLYARMATAGSVLAGEVTAIELLAGMPGSEHDPLWAVATITADCAFRGATPATAQAAFATSLDVAWAESPKLTLGQTGVFLLQPAPLSPSYFGLPPTVPYLVTDPLDVLPEAERAHVATLTLCPPSH